MDAEGEADAGYDDVDDDVYYAGYRSWDESTEGSFFVGVARVPLVLLDGIAARLRPLKTLARAWMITVAKKFPNRPLRELRSKCPSLPPPWLLPEFATYQVRTYRHTLLLE